MVLGFVGFYVHDFRILMRIFYIPGLFVFVFYFMVPESTRWLLATGRTDRAINTLKRIAKFNRRELSENTINALKLRYKQQSIEQNECAMEIPSLFQLLGMVLKSRKLTIRFILSCYQWIACCFCYYGLVFFYWNFYFFGWYKYRDTFEHVVTIIIFNYRRNHPSKFQIQITMLVLPFRWPSKSHALSYHNHCWAEWSGEHCWVVHTLW